MFYFILSNSSLSFVTSGYTNKYPYIQILLNLNFLLEKITNKVLPMYFYPTLETNKKLKRKLEKKKNKQTINKEHDNVLQLIT